MKATEILRAEERIAQKILQWLFDERFVTAGGETIIAKAVGMDATLVRGKVVVAQRETAGKRSDRPVSPGWYVATLANVPTAHARPFKVAIEAFTRDEAVDRLYKLYDFSNTSGIGRSMADALSESPVTDKDALLGACKYPLQD